MFSLNFSYTMFLLDAAVQCRAGEQVDAGLRISDSVAEGQACYLALKEELLQKAILGTFV